MFHVSDPPTTTFIEPASIVAPSLLFKKSKSWYVATYEQFLKRKISTQTKSRSENVFLVYFNHSYENNNTGTGGKEKF